MKFYEFGPTRSIRVRWTLQELGADFESVNVNLRAGEHRSPEFLKVNPAGKLPALLFTATELEQPLWRILRHRSLYPEQQRLPAEIPIASHDFRTMADVLEQHMQGRTFVAGDSVTVADFVLAYTLDWANEVHLLDRCPQSLAYMERMYARPHAPPRMAQMRAAANT